MARIAPQVKLHRFSPHSSHLHLLILEHFNGSVLTNGSAQENLADQFRVGRVGHVVLANVSVNPVAKVEILVIHGHDDVGENAGHVGQGPAFDLLGRNVDHFVRVPIAVVLLVESAFSDGKKVRKKEKP